MPRASKIIVFLISISLLTSQYLQNAAAAETVGPDSQTDAVSSGTADKNVNGRAVKVGFFEFDGYHMQDESGRKSGYGYDFLQEMARYSDFTYTYVGYDKSWSDMQDMLADGEIDLLTSAQKTPEREAKFAFSKESIGTSSCILTVKSGDTRFTAGDYSTYRNMRIGMLKNSSRNESLAEFASDKGFTYTAVYFNSADEMVDALQKGNGVDALLTSNLRTVSNEWILDQFSPSDFYVMVRKDDTQLLDEVNSAIEEMDTYLHDWRHELWDRYYKADTGDAIAFTYEERQYIDEMKKSGTVLRAIVNPDCMPFSYFSGGKACGIIPQLFDRIEAMTGLSIDTIEVKDRKEYFDMVNSGEGFDILMDSDSDYYDAEKNGIKITSPYLTATVSEVTRKSSGSDLKSLALVAPDVPAQYRDDPGKSGIKVKYYGSYRECLKAVQLSEEDAAYMYSYCAQEYMDLYDTGRLQVTLLPQYTVSFSAGVRDSDDNRLLTILDKAVGSLDESYVQKVILSQTEVHRSNISLYEFLLQNPIGLVFIFVAVGLIIGLAFLLLYRQKHIVIMNRKNRELAEAVQKADDANRAKSAFLSSISHDMRTPLNGVIGYTEFAIETDDGEKKQEYLGKIQQSAGLLLNMINDTLDVSRIESGKMVLEEEFVSGKTLYESIVMVTENAADKKGVHFVHECRMPDNEYVKIDKLQIQKLLLNLLSNAVKFTPDGGTVTLLIEQIIPPENGMTFRITVRDTGIGISKAFQSKIYDPFTQEHASESGNITGTGLGLHIAKRIVDMMHGMITVESETGKGTRFTVLLPIEYKICDSSEAEKTESMTADLSGISVLLCEDNTVNVEIARTMLEAKGMKVTCAENGRAGTEIFAGSAKGEFDLILMDIHMPEMDGIEAAEVIRSSGHPDALKIPIIAMTADAYDEDVSRCLNAGMNAHLAKPIDKERFFKVIAECLGISTKSDE